MIRWIVIPGLVVTLAGGCSGGGTADESAAEPAVDPRFATADGLIDFHNEHTTRDPADHMAFFERYHPETNFQRRIGNVLGRCGPILDLATAVRGQWGEEIFEGSDRFTTKPDGPATITEREADRAQATLTEHDGKEQTIYLVKVDGEWWFSGYTFEYDPDIKDRPDETLDGAEQMLPLYIAVAPELQARVEAGEFARIDEFRAAFDQALRDKFGMGG